MLIYLSLIDSEEDKSKFEQLYLSYRHVMHYVAKGILKNHHIAEDAVHEAFILIAKNIYKISDVSCPQTKGFVVIVVRNVSLTMLSKEKTVLYTELDESFVDDENVLDTIIQNQEQHRIVDAILEMPDTYKDTLYGFTVYEREELEYSITIIYQSEGGKEIFYSQYLLTQGEMIIDTEDATPEMIKIGEQNVNVVKNKGHIGQIHAMPIW